MAERAEFAGRRAPLFGIAHVAVFGVFGLADPLPGWLLAGYIRGEVVPSARRAAANPGAGNPVLPAALELGGEAGRDGPDPRPRGQEAVDVMREGVDAGPVVIRDGTPTGMTVALSRGGDRAAGAATSLDTNWDPAGRWGDERLSAAIAQADPLLPNEAEALRLSRAASLDAAAATLVAAGPRLVVKLGEKGALCADGAVRHRVRLPALTLVDATGAGDCFNAGLLAGLELPQATALGCAAGALSTGAPGGTASAPDASATADLARHASVTQARAGETTLRSGK